MSINVTLSLWDEDQPYITASTLNSIRQTKKTFLEQQANYAHLFSIADDMIGELDTYVNEHSDGPAEKRAYVNNILNNIDAKCNGNATIMLDKYRAYFLKKIDSSVKVIPKRDTADNDIAPTVIKRAEGRNNDSTSSAPKRVSNIKSKLNRQKRKTPPSIHKPTISRVENNERIGRVVNGDDDDDDDIDDDEDGDVDDYPMDDTGYDDDDDGVDKFGNVRSETISNQRLRKHFSTGNHREQLEKLYQQNHPPRPTKRARTMNEFLSKSGVGKSSFR